MPNKHKQRAINIRPDEELRAAMTEKAALKGLDRHTWIIDALRRAVKR